MEKEQIESELVISITELRRHFGKYLHLVIEGRTIIVTKYGERLLIIEPINENLCNDKIRE